MPFATAAATELWRERIGFYLDFYRRLGEQFSASAGFWESLAAAPLDLSLIHIC